MLTVFVTYHYFLGLRTMSVINNTLELVNKKRKANHMDSMTYKDIPINEIETYKFIADGHTAGVFQLESPGMTKFMKELFQDVHLSLKLQGAEREEKGKEFFERLIAGVSLYRPGPLDEIPNYLHNMLHPDEIVYDTEKIKPILSNTYGILVYQEQVIFAVRELAGFSKGQADEIRRAMGKKKEYIVNEYENRFIYGTEEEDKTSKTKYNIKGCLANGIPENEAAVIWQKMKKFARYAFNKSHAAAYADIAARCAWLAYHYPEEYFCSVLNSYINKSDKIQALLVVCQKKGINLLQPDVNASQDVFTVTEDNCIRYGLKGIRNVGGVSDIIIKEREENGLFDSMQHFVERMAAREKMDKKIIEALIYSSALDSFPGTRNAKLNVSPLMLKNASILKESARHGQLSLFSSDFGAYEDFAKIEIPDMPEFEKSYLLDKEREYSGFFVTAHPLDDYPAILNNKHLTHVSTLLADDEEVDSMVENRVELRIFGLMENLMFRRTKKNKPFNTFTLSDKSGDIKCVAFSECVDKYYEHFSEKGIVGLTGTVSKDDFGVQFIVNKVTKFN